MTPTIPCTNSRMQRALRRVRETRVTETCGRVVQLIGLVVESEGPLAALGEVVRIQSARGQADMLAFRDYLTALLDYVEGAIKAGKSKEEIIKLENFPGFPDLHVPPGPGNRLAGNLGAAYDELTTA